MAEDRAIVDAVGRKRRTANLRKTKKLLTNMFNVHDPDFGLDAVFLHASLAMANHSCVPNASAHIHGRTAMLVAERDIAEGEEITISYTGNSSTPLASLQ